MNMNRMFSLMSAMMAMSGMGIDELSPQIKIKQKRWKNYQFPECKYIGDIPKGCKLYEETFTYNEKDFCYTIDVSYIAGTIKSKFKKRNSLYNKIGNFLGKEFREHFTIRD